MDNQSTHIQSLFLKYSVGTASQGEVQELLTLLAEGTYDEVVISQMRAQMTALESQSNLDMDRWGNVLTKIKLQTSLEKKQTMRLWPRIAIAVAVATIIFGAGLFYYKLKIKQEQINQTAYINDVTPGKVGATLTLANGKKIRLADAVNGKLAEEAGVSITKSEDGQLVYEIKESDSDPNKINTLSTANGETYRVRLPDGSLIWLNAASSLTYSANLNDLGKRKVKLDGEAYFEISKDKKHPFIVKTDKQEVKVLGTHFNINAYADEAQERTTLLEGSVRVRSRESEKTLTPGQESMVTAGSIQIRTANIEQTVAWKNGTFKFEEEGIQNIMRQLSRWYDLEVEYQGKPTDELFYGEISRYKNISQTLAMLNRTKVVHFKIQGKKVTVYSSTN